MGAELSHGLAGPALVAERAPASRRAAQRLQFFSGFRLVHPRQPVGRALYRAVAQELSCGRVAETPPPKATPTLVLRPGDVRSGEDDGEQRAERERCE